MSCTTPIRINPGRLTATIEFDIEDLWHLYHSFSPSDMFAKDLWEVIQELESEEKRRLEGPGLRILLHERL